MTSLSLILVPAGVITLAALFIFVISTQRNKKDSSGSTKKRKGKTKPATVRIKEANKRLTQNPKDGQAMQVIADYNFSEEEFDKAFRSYGMLIDLCATDKELDEFEITLKYALSALKMGRSQDAYRAFMICRGMKQDVFEVDFNLGFLEYKRKQYDKAAALLLKARKQNPDHAECSKYLGQSLFKLGKMKETAILLRKVIELDPTDKETLFYLAQSYTKIGQENQALKIVYILNKWFSSPQLSD